MVARRGLPEKTAIPLVNSDWRAVGGASRSEPVLPGRLAPASTTLILRAASSSAARKSGWATEMSSFARCQVVCPLRFTAPNSVTIQEISVAGTVTMSPNSSVGTMFDFLCPCPSVYVE